MFVCAELPLVATGPRVSCPVLSLCQHTWSSQVAMDLVWAGREGLCRSFGAKGMLGRGRLVLWGQQGSAHTPQNL